MADLIPPRRGEFLTKEGVPTTRFAEYLERLTSQANTSAAVAEAAVPSTARVQVAALENRLGSGDALTSDETGFTADLTTLTVDMTEA